MSFAEEGEARLYYEIRGPRQGAPVLLIHGFGQQLVQWDVIGLSSRLIERGCRVVQYDQRDCGLSTRFEGPEISSIGDLERRQERGEPIVLPYGLEDMVTDVFSVMDACGVKSAAVVGHSLGGVVALLAALRQPERVEAVAMVSASLDNAGRLGPPPPGSAAIVEEVCTLRHPPELMLESIKWLQWVQSSPSFPMPLDLAADAARLMAERDYDVAGNLRQLAAFRAAHIPLDVLSRLEVGALIVHGSEDPLLPVAHGKDIAATLPHSELLVFEGAGHNVTPSMVADLTDHLLEFFES